MPVFPDSDFTCFALIFFAIMVLSVAARRRSAISGQIYLFASVRIVAARTQPFYGSLVHTAAGSTEPAKYFSPAAARQ